MIAIRRRDVASAQPRLKVIFAHEALDLLVVHDHALLPQSGSNTAPTVVFELVADGADGLDDRGVVGRRDWRIVIGRAGDPHQPTSFGDAET